MAANEDILYRTLERLAALEKRAQRNEWRLDALDKWRDHIDGRISVMESKVNDLRFSDAVAEALSQKLDARHQLQFTLLQKVGAGVFALVLVTVPVVIGKYL